MAGEKALVSMSDRVNRSIFRRFTVSTLIRSRYACGLVAGLVLACAFPKIGLAGAAWIGPGLIFASALGKSGWVVFRIGYVAGLAFYLAELYWLLFIPYRWHGIPLAPAAGWLALSAYLALYPAVWVWLLSGPRSTVCSPPSASVDVRHSMLAAFLPATWIRRVGWTLSGAAVWVGLEMILTRLFSGFPWDLLGVSQYQMLPLIQVASITGVYGISFLLVWVSLSFVSAALVLLRQPSSHSLWLAEIALPLVTVAILFNVGFRQLRHSSPPARTLHVTLVQPSIPQTLIWDAANDEQRFRDVIRLSEDALTNRTDLLLWPESGIPKLLRYDKDTFEAVTGLARKHQTWLMVGADDTELKSDGKTREFYNSSFLISPRGELMDGYRKRSLVIFGEYIPMVRWLPFMKFFTPIPGGFTPGDRPVQFRLSDLHAQVSPLICFEDAFPGLGREAAGPETDFLVNLTNDGWFGETAAPWQHAATALFRTVENGLPLVRCTNDGLTCWIDAQGRLRQICRDNKGTVYGPGILTADIPLLPPGETRAPTFYNRHGDLFGWICETITAILLGLKTIRMRRRERI